MLDEDLLLDMLFPEPQRPPSPRPVVIVYDRKTRDILKDDSSHHRDGHSRWDTLEIRLVGNHPLWGHLLWNASRCCAAYLDSNASLYRGKNVLELGAGGGLPGILTAVNGARKVVSTDYPDKVLIDNLERNVVVNGLEGRISVMGYIWGRPLAPLLEQLQPCSPSAAAFDLTILSDLLFNHSEHDALLDACQQALRPRPPSLNQSPPAVDVSPTSPCVLNFYTHHRPHLAHRDMEFFTKARERGWTCHKILTKKFSPMFPDDPGEEEVLSTVHGWILTL